MYQQDTYHKTDQDWLFSRKAFVRTLILSGVAVQLPWLTACINEDAGPKDTSPLSNEQYNTVCAVQEILWPDDGNGPNAIAVNADKYLLWVLRDSQLDPNENQFIIEGIDTFNQECMEIYHAQFCTLFEADKQDLVHFISKDDWGERWLSRLLTLIFEALLLDPAYGSNPDGIGWRWLDHDPGQPRPDSDDHLYPAILKKYAV